MNPSARKSLPPSLWYVVINGFFALLWAIGIPVVFFWHYVSWPLWAKIPSVVVFLALSVRIIDRHIPRLTNPVIEWVHDRIGSRNQ
jgi:hypothetical protein